MKLSELAQRLECHLEGDGEIEIEGVATLESARTGQISFLTNPKYFTEAQTTAASAIIVGMDCPALEKPLLKHEDPYLIFAKALEIFFPQPETEAHIHPTACIDQSATIGSQVSIGAYSVIGKGVVIEDDVKIDSHCTIYEGAKIGEKTRLYSGCAIREGVVIGKRCIIQNNVVIGSDGFGFAKQKDGRWYKILQVGNVVVEDDVEIGASTTIDRGTLGETRIGRGTKIDNLVQIGHGALIGEDSLICAQVGLAGSTKVGNRVILAGQVGAAGHLTIGDDAIATPQTGIPNSVEPGKIISGSPAVDHRVWLKSSAVIARLPEMQKTVRKLDSRVSKLESASDKTVKVPNEEV
jgi:UDP-3-O-[3-hydroxymyristoyl] glucosamine N-acyltransferase